MILQKYENLPDYMKTKELEKYFIELLDYAEYSKCASEEEISEALYELAIRQWHTYELIDKIIKDRIERWIEKIWNTKSIVLIDSLTSVIVNLGLEKSFENVKRSLNENVSKEVKEILEQTIKEIGGSICDPYAGMKGLDK